MEARTELDTHLRARTAQLEKMRAAGVKVVGVAPTGYLPEELVLASGAVPVSLIRGGDYAPAATSLRYTTRWMDTFWRSQIGYRTLKEEPLYQLIDLLVVPTTDHHVKAMADCFEFYTDIPVFRFGVPHEKTDDAFKYYVEGLHLLRARLEEVTGNKIKEDRLRETIDLCNRERELFRDISLMRKAEDPPIAGRDFVTLNHASLIADKSLMVEVLEALSAELRGKAAPPRTAPRIMLTGSTLAMGDYRIFDLLQETGAQVVIEHYSEGLRDYWQMVRPAVDLTEAIADCYFRQKVCHASFRPGHERIDFIVELCRDFSVDGVIHYMPMYRDCWELDTYLLADRLRKDIGLPMLKIETDYDASEVGGLRTRVATYVDTIKTKIDRGRECSAP